MSGPTGLDVGTAGMPITAGDRRRRSLHRGADPQRLPSQIHADAGQRAQIIERLHTARGLPGADRGDLGGMLREIARAMAD